MRPLALTVTFSHLASLFSALLLVPMFAYYFLRGEKLPVKPETHHDGEHGEETLGRLGRWYGNMLNWALNHRKTVLLSTLVLLLLSGQLTRFIGKEFLPKGDQGMIQVDLELPAGTPIEKTATRVDELERILTQSSEVDTVFVTIGGGSVYNPTAGTQTHKAVLNVQLQARSNRERSTLQVADEIRGRLRDVPGARIYVQVTGDQFGGGDGRPIQIRLRGDDPNVLRDLATRAVQEIRHVEGVREASAEREQLTQQLQVHVNREKALSYGLGNAQVASYLQQAVQGQTATQYRTKPMNWMCDWGFPPEMRSSVEKIKQLQIPSPLGTSVALGSIADIQMSSGPATISRYNNLREMTVEADYLGRDLGHIMDDIRTRLDQNLQLPSGYALEYGGESEQMTDAFRKLEGALVLAVILVYMVMAAQFESFFHPFIIMFSVPVTAVGVVIGLLVTDRSLGVGAFIGLIVLVGIVVNNAIILIDYINRLRKRGLERVEAVLRAGPVRLRPILMTAGATVLGVVPASLGFGEGAEVQAPLATVILFGLTFSTLITLILIPVVYVSLDSWLERRLKARR